MSEDLENIIRKWVHSMGTDCEGMCSSCDCLPKGNLKQDDFNEHTDKMTNSMEVSQPDSPHKLLSCPMGL